MSGARLLTAREYAAAFGPAPVTPCFCAADGSSYGYASGTAGTVSARVACLTTDSFGLRYQADVVEYGGGCCFRYVVRFWAPSGPSFVPFSCAVCGALQYEGLERAVGINAVFTRSGPAFAGPYSLLTRTLGRTSSGGQACFFGWGPSTGGPTDSPPAGYYYAFSTGSGFGQRWYFLPTDAGTDGVCSAEDITLKINGAWDQPNTEVTTTGTATVTLESTPCGPIAPPAPPPGDGEGERPAMLAARAVESPVCRHRSDDPLPSAGVAAAGLNPRIDWFRCERPGFERFGLPVTACRTCNTPADRRCGPLSGCPGYEPPDPD